VALASKNRIHLESRFPAVKKGMYDAVRHARDRALDEGEHEAENRLERANDSRGYNLPTEIEQEKTGHQSGLIRYGEFYGKWFEYGTVYIAPSPFMRPAHRKMRKRFLDEMDGNVEKFIRRKVGRIR
jgi:HK97 gp10 family phage protein